jgi:glycosyltransferase involved in cell wall biosynthesis
MRVDNLIASPVSEKVVTLVIPTLNRKSHLIRTVSSIAKYKDIADVLVINDGGTAPDSLPEWVTIVNLEKNRGESFAVNVGWKIASTKYFVVVSDDDPQPEGWLEPLIGAALANPNFIAYYPNCEILVNGEVTETIFARKYNRSEFIRFLRCPCLAGVLINRAYVYEHLSDGVRVTSVSYPSDLIQWLSLSRLGDFFAVSESTARWWVHSEQQSILVDSDDLANQYFDNVSKWAKENLNPIEQRIFLVTALLRSVQILNSRKLEVRKSIHFSKERSSMLKPLDHRVFWIISRLLIGFFCLKLKSISRNKLSKKFT